jgi:hypothetical protein
MTRGMKTAEAKKFVADKLGFSVAEIHAPVLMSVAAGLNKRPV